MDSAQSLLAQLPPADLEKNLKGLKELILAAGVDNPEAVRDALERNHPVPFQVMDCCDCDGEKPFLICGYNRVGDNMHRSPWTNQLHPKPQQSNVGDDQNATKNDNDDDDGLRVFEATFNDVWDSYKNLYYGHDSVGSVYIKDTAEGAFEGMFGIHKKSASGSWNSVSFVHVDEPKAKDCCYKVETSLFLILEPSIETQSSASSSTTKADISLTVSKEITKVCKIEPDKLPLNVSHIEHIGTLIEANEIDLRSNLEKVLIPKNQEILDVIQKKQDQSSRRPQVNPLMGMVMKSDLLKKKLAQQQAASEAEK